MFCTLGLRGGFRKRDRQSQCVQIALLTERVPAAFRATILAANSTAIRIGHPHRPDCRAARDGRRHRGGRHGDGRYCFWRKQTALLERCGQRVLERI
jgi:hypothetical protein